MQVTIHKNEELIRPISENLSKNRYKSHIDQIVNEVLREYPTYFWGGAVRDPLVKAKYGRNGETRDFDILVDDSQGKIDFKKLLKEFKDVFYTRLGSPKWRPQEGLEIDIVPFSSATNLRNGEKLPISLKTALQSCDFTTSAIAYDLKQKVLYSYGALEGIEKEEIDLLYSKGDETHILMCRALILAERLKFRKGPGIIKFITEKYTPSLDNHIKIYMEYKKLESKSDQIIEELRNIQANQTSKLETKIIPNFTLIYP